jgi:osmotically inducible lipoprotein OsmB
LRAHLFFSRDERVASDTRNNHWRRAAGEKTMWKRVAGALAISACWWALSGCTATGAVAGGVVGHEATGGSTAGTVGGAVVGGVIGHELGK